jgi:hypothetical protein
MIGAQRSRRRASAPEPKQRTLPTSAISSPRLALTHAALDRTVWATCNWTEPLSCWR